MTSTNKPIITRFAPSPTGYLHIGGARTALYNYLYAKKHGGHFILRIEDTDLERSTDASIQAILDGMQWLGLNWDDGPYYQTRRFDLYQAAIDKLIATGKAYPCFCRTEELSAKRDKAIEQKSKYRYDRTCYHLPQEERLKRLGNNEPHVIRFLSTDSGSVTFQDLLKGEVSVDCREMDDLIIRRTDGSPTYNLSVVIDDASMGITHVIRGDDHLNNTPRQIQMYQALGYDLPVFAHLPMILGPDKKRLSKRHGATSVMAYKDMGYLPQAILNYLVRLGWGYKDQEVFSPDEMIGFFDVKDCSNSSAVFDFQKLDWLNAHYIKVSNGAALAPLVIPFLKELGIESPDLQVVERAVSLSLEKAKTLKELADYIKIFFVDMTPDAEALQKNITAETLPILKRVYEELERTETLNRDNIHKIFETVMNEHAIKLGKVANPVRVALSGQKVSPGAYDLIELFGKEKTLQKLRAHL